jgi:hypothetical protein
MLVDGILPMTGVVVLAGSPKVGKSLLAGMVALAVGGDAPMVLGRAVGRHGPVLWVTEEGGLEAISYRFRHQLAAQSGAAPALFIAYRQRLRLDRPDSVRFLRSEVAGLQPALVVIDPLNRAHGADENRPTEMTRVMDALSGIAARFECLVVANHHLAKPSAERRGTIWDRFRGASAIRSATDANLALEEAGSAGAHLVGEFRDAEPLELDLVLDRGALVFGLAEGRLGKIDPDELLEFVRASGEATGLLVCRRFEVTKKTALAALDEHPDLDSYTGPRGVRTYFVEGDRP